MSQRPDSVIASALRHGMRMDMSIEDAAVELLRVANGDRRRIEQAIARIDRGSPGPPGPVREYASEALRLAWEWSLHPSVAGGHARLTTTR